MKPDPIVAEVRRIRRQLVKEHGGIEGLFKFLTEQQEKSGRKYVTLPPKPAKPRTTEATK